MSKTAAQRLKNMQGDDYNSSSCCHFCLNFPTIGQNYSSILISDNGHKLQNSLLANTC